MPVRIEHCFEIPAAVRRHRAVLPAQHVAPRHLHGLLRGATDGDEPLRLGARSATPGPRAQRVGRGIGFPAGGRRRNGHGLGYRGGVPDAGLPRRRAWHLPRPCLLRRAARGSAARRGRPGAHSRSTAPIVRLGGLRDGAVPSLLRRWALPRRVSGVVRRRALALFHATGDGSRAMTWRTKGVPGAPRRGVGKLSHIYHDAPSQPTTRPRGVLATTPMRPTRPRRSVAARSTASANSRSDAGAPWRARTGTRRAVGLRACAAASWADSSQTSRSDGVREYSKCLRPGQESGCCVIGPDETGPRGGGGAGGSGSDGAATGPSRWYRAAGVRKCLRAVGSPAACVGAAPAWVGAPRASRRLVPPWRGGGGESAGSRRRAPRPSQPAASSASTPSWATSESTDCLPNDWPATTRRAGLRLLYWRSAGVRVKSSFHAGRAAMMSVL